MFTPVPTSSRATTLQSGLTSSASVKRNWTVSPSLTVFPPTDEPELGAGAPKQTVLFAACQVAKLAVGREDRTSAHCNHVYRHRGLYRTNSGERNGGSAAVRKAR